jgi:hypothetical protein
MPSDQGLSLLPWVERPSRAISRFSVRVGWRGVMPRPSSDADNSVSSATLGEAASRGLRRSSVVGLQLETNCSRALSR